MKERKELEIPEQRVKEKELGCGAQLQQEPTERVRAESVAVGNLGKMSKGN